MLIDLFFLFLQRARVRFNGPARANNPKDLLSDLKIIRVMIKTQLNSPKNSPKQVYDGQNSSAVAATLAASVVASAAAAVAASVAATKAAMSLEVLQQLPNTVSVSFKDVKSYEIIDQLSEQVWTI